MQPMARVWICVSAALFLVSAGRGFGEVDRWLNYTSEGTHFREQGRYSDAERRYLDAYRLAADSGERSDRLVVSLSHLAVVYRDEGRYGDAEIFARRALEVRRQVSNLKSPAMAVTLNNLAEIYRLQSRHTEAEPLFLEALPSSRRPFGQTTPIWLPR